MTVNSFNSTHFQPRDHIADLPLCVRLCACKAVFHEVSVYPKKELPFFILFTAGLCSFTAMLALLTHQFPELMGVFAKAVSTHAQTHTHVEMMSIL